MYNTKSSMTASPPTLDWQYFSISKTVSLFSTIQQICVAGSTYVMLEAAASSNQLTVGELVNAILYFVGFIFTAYISGIVSNYFLIRDSHNCWSNYSQTAYRACAKNKERYRAIDEKHVHHWLVSEAQDNIFGYQAFQSDTYAIILNVLFNTIVIYSTIGPFLFLVILLSISVGAVIFFFINKKIKLFSSIIQRKRLGLFAVMEKYIDRTVYVPRSRRALEQERLFNSFSALRKTEEYNLIYQSLPTLVMISMISVLLVAGFQLERYQSVGLMLAVVIATPRLVQILQYASSFFFAAGQFSYYSVRLLSMKNFIMELAAPMSADKISIQIKINGRPYRSLDSALEFLSQQTKGRFTLRGENGSGKSTLLHLLKSQNDHSVLINPENVSNLADITGSTGQTVRHAIEQYLEMDDVVLLLDEWDANLDNLSKEKIDKFLDKSSKNHLVVEVRHH